MVGTGTSITKGCGWTRFTDSNIPGYGHESVLHIWVKYQPYNGYHGATLHRWC